MTEVAQEAVQETAKREVRKVTMEDGRVLEFAGKRKIQKEAIIENGKLFLRFDFSNGAVRKYPVRDEHILQFAGHGGLQKYGDEVAGEDDVEDAILAIDDLHERVHGRGEWNVKREGKGSFSGVSMLVKALVELSGGSKSVDEVKEFLRNKSREAKDALKASPRVQTVIQRLMAEKAQAKGIDAEAELNALLG